MRQTAPALGSDVLGTYEARDDGKRDVLLQRLLLEDGKRSVPLRARECVGARDPAQEGIIAAPAGRRHLAAELVVVATREREERLSVEGERARRDQRDVRDVQLRVAAAQ